MTRCLSHLTTFTAAVATGQAYRFEEAVKTAYEAGASREELLLAVDSARHLTQIPALTLGQAYATIHAWHWMESRRAWHRRELTPQAA
jgi:alkylhydroperoxidase/carboxymuconolactone decarboxylase family protein YurZ